MARILPTKSEVLELLAAQSRALHAREIAQRLGARESAYDGVLRILDDLVFDGVLTARPGQKFQLAKNTRASRGEEREGFLTVAPRGFGFVWSTAAPGDDVYIARESLRGAMQGDRVRIAVRSRGSRGPEGEIVAIVERGIRRVAGTLRRRGSSAWLEPDDSRIRGPIVLEKDVDRRAGEGNSGSDGDAAVVSIVRYPELPDENPVGKLEAVLGKPGELNVEVAKVLVREQIEEVHSGDAFAEAEAFGDEVPVSMLERREDLTALPLPTIDPEDARDHDDAVWVERRGDGYRAWIAIADVSSYVRPGTKLDEEAHARGCSIYLPDRAIPMLPRPLSSNLCSLLPDVVRLCLCADVELDADGVVRKTRLVRGFMRSGAKLTYGGVARALGFSAEPAREPRAEELVDGLRIAYELSRKLRARRLKRGAIDLDLPEARIVLGDEGIPIEVKKRAQDPGVKKAYQLIEELMLLANEAVARWLVERRIGAIFRVHAPPDEQKLARFAAMCEVLGIPFDVADAQDPRKLSELVKTFTEHPKAQVLSMLLLRSMKQATYDVINIGHFGLASKAYVHFTSPIRRYPDLVVHRGVHAALLDEPTESAGAESEEFGEAAVHSSMTERKAMEIEREIADLYRCVYMKDKIGQRFVGTVTGLVGSGVFVALDSPFVDVIVRFEDLGARGGGGGGGGGAWALDDDGLFAKNGRSGEVVQLGQTLAVEIIDVSLLRRSTLARRVPLDGQEEAAESVTGHPRHHRGHGQSRGDDRKGRHAHDGPRQRGEHHQGGGARTEKPKKKTRTGNPQKTHKHKKKVRGRRR